MNSKANLFLKATLLLLAVAFFSFTSSAQTEDQSASVETITVNTRLVTITVTGVDAKGRPASIDGSHLRLYADGAEQQPAFVHNQDSASNVVLLVDTSGSMRGPTAKETRYLVRQFLQASDPRNHYLLFTFSNGIRSLGEFQGDEDGQRALIQALEAARYGGATAIFASAQQALKAALAARPAMKTSLVIFTDGVDNADGPLVEDLKSFGGFVGAFVIGQSADYNMLDSLYYPIPKEETRRLANALQQAIGGQAYVARGSNKEIATIARQVADTIRSSVEIGFYPQDRAAEPGTHSLRVESSVTDAISLNSRLRYSIEK